MNGWNLLMTLGMLGVVSGLLVTVIGLLVFRGLGFNKFWLSTPPFIRKLISYQSIGISSLIVIFIALHFPPVPSMLALEEFAMDTVMSLHRNIIPPLKEKVPHFGNSPHFVLLDIDGKTQRKWGEQSGGELSYTPRDRLKNLIDAAVRAEARLIIVDINMSEPESHDLELKNYFDEHIIKCKENQSSCSPIILVRAFGRESSHLVTPQTGFFDEVVTTQSAPYIQWGSARFYSFEEEKNLARRWELWESTCIKGQPGVLPSIELLAMAMIRDCTENMQNALSKFQSENCNSGGKVIFPDSISPFCGLKLSTNPYSTQQRIMYRIPWSGIKPSKKLEKSEMPEVEFTVYYGNNNENKNKPILTVFSAQPYAEPQLLSQEILEKTLGKKIVFIGSSHTKNRDKTDSFSTPIGEEMPGSLVLINATYSLLQGLIIESVSFWTWLIIIISFIFVVTLSSSLPGQQKYLGWIVIFSIIGGLLFYSVVLFENGIWLNIAILLTIIESYRGIYQKIYQWQWFKERTYRLFGIHDELDKIPRVR